MRIAKHILEQIKNLPYSEETKNTIRKEIKDVPAYGENLNLKFTGMMTEFFEPITQVRIGIRHVCYICENKKVQNEMNL